MFKKILECNPFNPQPQLQRCHRPSFFLFFAAPAAAAAPGASLSASTGDRTSGGLGDGEVGEMGDLPQKIMLHNWLVVYNPL